MEDSVESKMSVFWNSEWCTRKCSKYEVSRPVKEHLGQGLELKHAMVSKRNIAYVFLRPRSSVQSEDFSHFVMASILLAKYCSYE